jgi:hypothetical protein
MMDAILKPDVQEVIIQKSTQIQKAETSQNLVLDSFRVLADDSESMTISAFVGTNPTDEPIAFVMFTANLRSILGSLEDW